MYNTDQKNVTMGLDEYHEKIAEQFVECFGGWTNDIEAIKDSGTREVTVIMHSGKQYQFGYKDDGGIYLHSH